MKAQPYSPAMMKAWKQTVAAYDKLIKTGNAEEWQNYGMPCRLCKAGGLEDGCGNFCVLGDCEAKGRMGKTFDKLKSAVWYSGDKSKIKQAARKRLAAMKAVVNLKLRRRGQSI